jgi:D-amino-acid oxidase
MVPPPTTSPPTFLILGAGVIGLSTALTLRKSYPTSPITIIAKHFPGDLSIDYASPWAGANWAPFSNDNGPLEHYDRVTFKQFERLVDGLGLGEQMGVGRMGLRGFFEEEMAESGLISKETGEVWFRGLVGGLDEVGEKEVPEGVAFGVEFGSTWRIDTGVYLNWWVFFFSLFVFYYFFLLFLREEMIQRG